jgi:hypothetical protein
MLSALTSTAGRAAVQRAVLDDLGQSSVNRSTPTQEIAEWWNANRFKLP